MLAILVPALARGESEIVFRGAGECLPPKEARARFEEVIFVLELQREPQAQNGEPRRTPALRIEVDEEPCADRFCLDFKVASARGEPLLERRYQFSRTDCASARELLAAVLERFLQQLPFEAWTEEAPAEPLREEPPPYPLSPPPPPERGQDTADTVLVSRDRVLFTGLAIGLAAQSAWAPSNGELEVAPTMDLGLEGHRIWFGPVLRIGLPRALGEGRVLEGQALVGLGYVRVLPSWRLRAGLLGGVAIVDGYGFETNNRVGVLPWVEAVLGAELRLGAVWIGLQAGGGFLEHRLKIPGSPDATTLSNLRLGLSVMMPLWDNG